MRKRVIAFLMSAVLAFTSFGFMAYANEISANDVNTNETVETVSEETSYSEDVIIEDDDIDELAVESVCATGECGDNLTYTLKETNENGYDYILIISGTGDMYNFGSAVDYITKCNDKVSEMKFTETKAPWKEYQAPNLDNKNHELGRAVELSCYSTKLVIEDGVTSIGYGAFDDCHSISGQVVIPDSVKSIGVCAFNVCNRITDVVLSNSLKEIKANSFACTRMEKIVIPEGVETIEPRAFYDSTVKTVVFPNSLKRIGSTCFEEDDNIEYVYIPDNVEWLGNRVFAHNDALKYISGGKGLKHIGGDDDPQYNNRVRDSKETIYSYPDNFPSTYAEGYFFFDNEPFNHSYRDNNTFILCDTGSLLENYFEAIKAVLISSHGAERFYAYTEKSDDDKWVDELNGITGKCGDSLIYALTEYNDEAGISENDAKVNNKDDKKYVLTIAGTGNMYDYCYEYPTANNPFVEITKAPWFRYNDDIVKVVIGNDVTSIGKEALSGCKNLKEIAGGNAVKNIGKKAFYVSKLTETKLDSKNDVLKNYEWTADNRKVSVTADDQNNNENNPNTDNNQDDQNTDNNQDDQNTNNNQSDDNNNQDESNTDNEQSSNDNKEEKKESDKSDVVEPAVDDDENIPEKKEEVKEITVTFDPNGGSVKVESLIYKVGDYFSDLPIATSNYGIFAGWYTEKENGVLITDKTKVSYTENITLYACWANYDVVVNQKYDVSGLYGKDNAIKKYKVECSNGAKASINKKGVVKASKPGIVTITPLVKVNKKYVALEGVKSLTLTVVKPTVTKNITGKVGDSICLNDIVSGMPENSINKITYSIPKNCKYAELDETTNILTLKKKGSVKVTVTITNNQSNSVKYSCKVKIKK